MQCLCVHTKPHEALTGIWSVFFLFFFLICLPMARKWYLFQLFSKENWCETFFQAFPQFSFYIGVKVVFPVWYERVCWSFSVLNYQEPRYAPPEILVLEPVGPQTHAWFCSTASDIQVTHSSKSWAILVWKTGNMFLFPCFLSLFLVSSVKKYDVGKMAAQQSVKLCSSTVHKQ